MRCTELRLVLAALAAGLTIGCATPPPTEATAPGELAMPGALAADWDDYKLRAAERIVAANPQRTYDGPVPDVLLAIPVLEIELEADGRVRAIHVQRVPGQATDTVQLAIDAVRRAAPFGDVAHLPPPWRFTEVFLFDNDRRFKPATLDR